MEVGESGDVGSASSSAGATRVMSVGSSLSGPSAAGLAEGQEKAPKKDNRRAGRKAKAHAKAMVGQRTLSASLPSRDNTNAEPHAHEDFEAAT